MLRGSGAAMINEPLSKQGTIRRQQILSLAHAEARRRRRRLLIGRSFLVAGMFAVAGSIVWSLIRLPGNPLPVARVLPVAPPPPVVAIEYVQTDPTITDRLSIKPEPPRWTNVGDDELLQELAAAGQPAGIVCMNGKTILLPR